MRDDDDDGVAQHGGYNPNNSLTETCNLGLLCTSLIFDIHVMINWHLSKRGIHWPVSRDYIVSRDYKLYHVTISWPLTNWWFSIGSRAHVWLTCCKMAGLFGKRLTPTEDWKLKPNYNFVFCCLFLCTPWLLKFKQYTKSLTSKLENSN